ncbi:MAG: hypothetical protein L0387_37285 [Acidobacteria bacterium]|nr:hypothetical protein [Acidobacteriota bacterium]
MNKFVWLIFPLLLCAVLLPGQEKASTPRGLRGDPAAIAEAEAMVATMGGREIWAKLKSIHFVHEWHLWNRADSYLENEILDLVVPRSWIEKKSEINYSLQGFSPEHKIWRVVNGEFSWGTEEEFKVSTARAPFHFVRLARAIAIGDPFYEVRFVEGDFKGTRRLEFRGPDGVPRGWMQLNARKEPLTWATTEYRYTFGPMKTFGNLRVPNWATTGNGAVTFEMRSLTGSAHAPDPSLFVPPPEFTKDRKQEKSE